MTDLAGKALPGNIGLDGRSRRPLLVIGIASAFFVIYAVWAIVTPLLTATDEWYHVLRAVSLADGQLKGDNVQATINIYTEVRVPEVLTSGQASILCSTNDALDGPVTCDPTFAGSPDREAVALTGAGLHPPLYYLPFGTLFDADRPLLSLYVMRLVSALACAMVTTRAVWLAARSLGLMSAIALACFLLTPTVAYLAAIVNPNGLEICALAWLWVAALVLATRLGDERLVRAAAIETAAAYLLSTQLRPLGLLTGSLVLIGGLLLGTTITGTPLISLRRLLRCRPLVVTVSGCVVLWAGWALYSRHLFTGLGVPYEGGLTDLLYADQLRFFAEALSLESWNRVHVEGIALLWTAIIALWLSVVLMAGRRRHVVAAALIGAAWYVLPILTNGPSVTRNGVIWVGRYGYGVLLGLSLLAGAVAASTRVVATVRLAAVASTLAGLGLIIGWWESARRWTVGRAGPRLILGDLLWRPPVHPYVLVAALVVAVGSLLAAGYVGLSTRAPVESPPTGSLSSQ